MHFLIALSLAPVIVLLVLFYWLDRFEPEPRKVVLKVFGFGVLSVIPAAILELLYSGCFPGWKNPHDLAALFISIFICVGFVEEFCKFLVVYLGVYRSPEFDEPYDGITYTVAASLGFAALENILYVVQSGMTVGILRAILSVPGHALFGVIMGYYMGKARFTDKSSASLNLLTGLFAAAFAHTVFDFVLFSQNVLLILMVFPITGALWIIAIMLARKAQALSIYRYNPQKENGPAGPTFLCPHCSFSMPEESTFCMKCGGKVREGEPEAHTPFCLQCGTTSLAGSIFCMKCGSRLADSSINEGTAE
ncbi:MAG: PrsW family glutamic-type intramembrane protease [Candidatus Xenobiia bacterium LiM19]